MGGIIMKISAKAKITGMKGQYTSESIEMSMKVTSKMLLLMVHSG